jgi:hypothetical protein
MFCYFAYVRQRLSIPYSAREKKPAILPDQRCLQILNPFDHMLKSVHGVQEFRHVGFKNVTGIGGETADGSFMPLRQT